MNVEEVFEAIKGATLAEVNDLAEKLQDEFGVAAMAAMPMAGGAGPEAAVEEEKTEFDVVLVTAGDKKIPVIKAVREITELGLKEAKALYISAPAPIKEGVPKEDAEKFRDKLEEAGAQVELK